MSWSARSSTRAPLGRVAIATQIALALLVVGFLMTRFDIPLPVVHETYDVRAILPDAAGLDPSHRPAVVAGGVPVGRVTGVRFSPTAGRAIATLQLSDASRGKLFTDATVRIVPRSALQDLVIDVSPGTPAAGALQPGATITAGWQATPVSYDRVLGVLDADTRAYTQILLDTLREVLRDRPGPLRAALDRLPALDSPLTRLAEELARRRRDVSALVSELDAIASATGRRGLELANAIRVTRTTLTVTAARQQEIERSFAELPPTLRRVDTSLRAVQDLATPLVPALAGLRPTARALPSALRATRTLLPNAQGLIDDVRPVVTRGQAPLAALSDALTELPPTARAVRPLLPVLEHLVATLDGSHADMLALLGNWPGAISIAGNTGVETRALLIGTESLQPPLFGMDTAADRSQLARAMQRLRTRRPDLVRDSPTTSGGSLLDVATRALLISTCRTNSFACVIAMGLERQGGQGLPGSR